MTEWDYLVETINTEYVIDGEGNIDNSPDGSAILSQVLNVLGTDGWELVSFLPALPAPHFDGTPQNPYVFHAIFKRRK